MKVDRIWQEGFILCLRPFKVTDLGTEKGEREVECDSEVSFIFPHNTLILFALYASQKIR